jgi:hypothetical protein
MKLLSDPLGRPIERLFFSTEELDERSERNIADFMDLHCGRFQAAHPNRRHCPIDRPTPMISTSTLICPKE